MKKSVGMIDMTPSSVDLVNVIILLLESKSAESKAAGKAELVRIARLADARIKFLKEKINHD